MQKKVVILGNGVAGITAARYVRKASDHEITVVSSESDHFFSRTALMYIYMGHMTYEETKPYEDRFWEANRIGLRRAHVERVDTRSKRLCLTGGDSLEFDVLVLATGSVSNRFGWPGQDLDGVQGLYSLQDLERMERSTRDVERAVVVGGGLIGVETAEMLLSRRIPVTFLVREPSWMDFAFPAEESAMINRQIRRHGVDLRLSTELERIEADASGRVRAVLTTDGDEIDCRFVALTVGVSPNVSLLEGSGIDCGKGVLVDELLRTNVPDVYAIGDCAQVREPRPGRRPVEPLWYTGRLMGQTVARTICGDPTVYDPGVWFNSAKFFDLEWQVYGRVPAARTAGLDSVYWEDEGGFKSIRIVHQAPDGPVVGFNVMGIRYRHDVCQAWIREERPLREVLRDLGAANFDPELFAEHEAALVEQFNRRSTDAPIRLRRRRGLAGLFGARRAS